MSTIDAAIAFVDDFEANGGTDVAWRLDRYWTLQRIRTLVRNPELLHQRGLNACGPAVFFRIWFSRDPLAAATFACHILRDGSAYIGTMAVAAGWKLRDQDYGRLKSVTDSTHGRVTPENADWMLLSGLRDSENIWFDYVGEPNTVGDMAAGITLPNTLGNWLNATGLYGSVSNETTVVFGADEQQLLNFIPTSNVDIVLLVSSSFNAPLYPSPPRDTDPGIGGLHIPNHYVLVTAPFAVSNDSRWLQVEVWSWAGTVRGWTGREQFRTKYFGPIVATTP